MSTHNQKIDMTAVGDVFLGDSPFRIGHGVRSSLEKNGWENKAESIRALLGQSDLHFCNLEAVLSSQDLKRWSIASVEMRGRQEFVKFIYECGWNVVNIANNHIFQHGLNAFIDTTTTLEKTGIAVVGCERNGRTLVEEKRINGSDVIFAGFSLRPEQYHPKLPAPYSLRASMNSIIEETRVIRSRYSGHLIVSLHWGHEFLHDTSFEQQQLAHELVDSGVSVILGHHPHVVQGVEEYHDSIISYSLGNFICDIQEERAKNSFVLKFRLDGAGVDDYEIMPIRIADDYMPERVVEPFRSVLLDKVKGMSYVLENGSLKAGAALDIEETEYYKKVQLRYYRYFTQNIFRYSLLFSVQSVMRALYRRLKAIIFGAGRIIRIHRPGTKN